MAFAGPGKKPKAPWDSSSSSDMPPPGHPVHNILRMTGVSPMEPDKPNATLEKLGLGASVVDKSPLELLHRKIVEWFAEGPAQASIRFSALDQTVRSHEQIITKDAYAPVQLQPLLAEQVPWNSCKLAATLILILAAPNDTEATYEALKAHSQSMGGLPTMKSIESIPSASLGTAFAKAKKAAIDGKVGKVTVLAVSLVDVEMIERGERKSRDMSYTSFAHVFVLGISRTGWRIYQSWGKHGYRLDQWIANGGAQLRDWKDAKRFLKTFDRLAEDKGKWSKEINEAYDECFDIDIFKTCGKNGPQDPIVPMYRPWVRIYALEDVQSGDIEKFTWQ